MERSLAGYSFLASTSPAASDIREEFENAAARLRDELTARMLGKEPPSVPSQDNPARPMDWDSFYALPSGAWFINPADDRLLQK